MLVVDDAHALDATSAALVHQVVAADEGQRTRGACGRREPVPDAIVALWKDDLCERVELQPLSRPEVAELLASVLDGPVEAATAHALWDASRGNVMFLRELVRSGLDSDALVMRQGLWSWPGPRRIAPRLAELLAENLAALDEDERAVLEVLALGEPLELGRAREPDVGGGGGGARDEAPRRNRRPSDGRLRARLGHPLVGDVLQDALPDPKRRRLLRALADAIDARRRRTTITAELLRVVTWQLDAGVPVEPDAPRGRGTAVHSHRHRIGRAPGT